MIASVWHDLKQIYLAGIKGLVEQTLGLLMQRSRTKRDQGRSLERNRKSTAFETLTKPETPDLSARGKRP